MKKLTALMLCVLMGATLLAGCNKKDEPTATPEEILNKIVEEIGEDNMPMMGDIDDDTMSTLYGITSTDLLEDYRGKTSMMNVHADEILVAKVKEDKMEDVEKGIAQRQEDLDATWSQYLPDVYETVKDARVVKNGNYILFVVSENADKAVSVFDEMTKS